MQCLRLSVADGQEEALEVAAALVPQGVLQGHVVLLQVQVFDGLQVKLWTEGKTFRGRGAGHKM